MTDELTQAQEKAVALIEQRRVFLSKPRQTPLGDVPPGALVLGETDVYQVWFDEDGVVCECYAGCEPTHEPKCSHAMAAMIAWHDYSGTRRW